MNTFSEFESSNESSPNSSCLFWDHMVGVYANFASLFNVTPLYFLSSNFNALDKKSASKWNFWTFECFGKNSANSSCLFWNQESVFLQTLHHSSISWKITLPYFFIWIFICFGQKDPIKVQIFRLSTARMKINQISYVIF